MRFNYFAPPQTHDFAQKCLQIFKSGEVGIFIFFPKTDRVRRVAHVIQDFKNNMDITQMSFSPVEADNLEDVDFLSDLLLDKQLGKSKQEKAIFITNADFPIYQRGYQVIDSFVKIQEDRPYLHFILLFETDITHPDIAKNFAMTSVFANVNYYPLYSQDDALGFVSYLADKWNLKIEERIKEKIARECGGQFWLLKYTVRTLRDNPKMDLNEIFQSDQMQFRLEQISNSLLESERIVLKKLIKGESVENENEKHSLGFLKKIKLLDYNEITIPLLEDYLRKNLPKVNIQITEHHILLNDIRVDSHFSKQEKRAFKALLDSKNQVVTRDVVAKAIWPINTEEKYSDWAVDRLIARLRGKIIELGMPKDIIKTFRNKGYMLVN